MPECLGAVLILKKHGACVQALHSIKGQIGQNMESLQRNTGQISKHTYLGRYSIFKNASSRFYGSSDLGTVDCVLSAIWFDDDQNQKPRG